MKKIPLNNPLQKLIAQVKNEMLKDYVQLINGEFQIYIVMHII